MVNMAKLLLIDDDADLLSLVADELRAERFVVETAASANDAYAVLNAAGFDLVIVDWQLPDESGLQIIGKLRSKGLKLPIIMLTGKNTIEDKETGFGTGADDYLTKPFNMRELVARIRALLRRASNIVSNSLQYRDIVLDPDAFLVTRSGAEVRLSKVDFALLEFFMRHPGQVFTVEAILGRVWHTDSAASHEGLRAAIRRIRKALESNEDPSESIIENVPRVGYRLRLQ